MVGKYPELILKVNHLDLSVQRSTPATSALSRYQYTYKSMEQLSSFISVLTNIPRSHDNQVINMELRDSVVLKSGLLRPNFLCQSYLMSA